MCGRMVSSRCYLFVFLCFALLDATKGQFIKQRKTALMKGDIMIGVLVSVHHLPTQKTARQLECGEIREQYGVQRVEAAYFAIDQINNDPNILPNIKLGTEIRDSCWYSLIALEQTIEFIRDAMIGPDTRSNKSIPDTCPQMAPSTKNLVGVVGPPSSTVTIQVQNLLTLFGIPQVGYSATSLDLSDKSRFSYFLRVVPSDYFQAQVMVDIVKHYNWTYVSAVHTDGNYGQSGMTAFRELGEKNNICIAKEDSVLSNAEPSDFDDVIRRLSEDKRANVVVCFCEGMTVRNLLMAAQRLNKVSRFLFIGSDGWADRSDVIAGIEEAAVGSISVKIHSSYVHEFDDHYLNLKPDSNHRNPWFKEFWQYRFNCSYPNATEDDTPSKPDLPPCTGQEKLIDGYKQDTKMSFVIKGIYTMAYGLHAMQKDVCKGRPGICSEMLPINGSLFRDYLMNVTFSYMNETVSFDSKGDPPGRYDIMNFQKLPNGSYDYIHIGSWDNGTFALDESLVMFNGSDREPPSSVCSVPCSAGQVKSIVTTGDSTKSCCWICGNCAPNEYLANETSCAACNQDQWPNANKTGCYTIEPLYQDWYDTAAIAAMVLALVVFIATVVMLAIFIKFRQTPIVKASTQELCYIIFGGMMIACITSLPLLHMPTSFTCGLSRSLPGISYAMMYGALCTKTNRIARVLADRTRIRIKKQRFMSSNAQIVITSILVTIEVFIILGMLIYEPPLAVNSYPKPGVVVLICNTSVLGDLVPLGWNCVLIVFCTHYGVKTRNVPTNYNESKFIGFSMYTTCVIWVAWVTLYFGSDHKILCTSVCTSLSALVILIILFFPKAYTMIFKPERNYRSSTYDEGVGEFQRSGQFNRSSGTERSISQPSSLRTQSVESKWTGLILRLRAAKQLETDMNRSTSLKPAMREAHPRAFLKRGTSLWGEIGNNMNRNNTTQHRDMLLRKTYGSQLDLDGGASWSQESIACQTTDELLDPLIPRLRRRVVRAVKEGTIDPVSGREFFNQTHFWMQAQADAAKALRQSNIDPKRPIQTEIINECALNEINSIQSNQENKKDSLARNAITQENHSTIENPADHQNKDIPLHSEERKGVSQNEGSTPSGLINARSPDQAPSEAPTRWRPRRLSSDQTMESSLERSESLADNVKENSADNLSDKSIPLLDSYSDNNSSLSKQSAEQTSTQNSSEGSNNPELIILNLLKSNFNDQPSQGQFDPIPEAPSTLSDVDTTGAAVSLDLGEPHANSTNDSIKDKIQPIDKFEPIFKGGKQSSSPNDVNRL